MTSEPRAIRSCDGTNPALDANGSTSEVAPNPALTGSPNNDRSPEQKPGLTANDAQGAHSDLDALADAALAEHARGETRAVPPTCPRCDGWGRLHNATGGEWFDCEECGGTGFDPRFQTGDSAMDAALAADDAKLEAVGAYPPTPAPRPEALTGEAPQITDHECEQFYRHAENGATADWDGVDYALIQPYDLQRFAMTVKALRRERDEARRALEAWEEREARICPEDFGFEEYIISLNKRIDSLCVQLGYAEEAVAAIAARPAETPEGR